MGSEELLAFASHKYRHNCLPSGAGLGLEGLIFDKYLLSLGYNRDTHKRVPLVRGGWGVGGFAPSACSEYQRQEEC